MPRYWLTQRAELVLKEAYFTWFFQEACKSSSPKAPPGHPWICRQKFSPGIWKLRHKIQTEGAKNTHLWSLTFLWWHNHRFCTSSPDAVESVRVAGKLWRICRYVLDCASSRDCVEVSLYIPRDGIRSGLEESDQSLTCWIWDLNCFPMYLFYSREKIMAGQ